MLKQLDYKEICLSGSQNCNTINWSVDGHQSLIRLDTQSTKSLLNKQHVKKEDSIHESNTIFTGIGWTQQSLGTCNKTISSTDIDSNKEIRINHRFEVIDLPIIGVLLGHPFLKEHRAILDYNKMKL